MTKAIFLLSAAVLTVGAPAVSAAYDAITGHYASNTPRGNDLTADVTRVSAGNYNVSLSTTVAMVGDRPGCGGSVEGQVRLNNGRGVLRTANPQYTPGTPGGSTDRYCEISVAFSRNQLQIQELRGCTGYHGAACEFTGRLMHDAAGI